MKNLNKKFSSHKASNKWLNNDAKYVAYSSPEYSGGV